MFATVEQIEADAKLSARLEVSIFPVTVPLPSDAGLFFCMRYMNFLFPPTLFSPPMYAKHIHSYIHVSASKLYIYKAPSDLPGPFLWRGILRL